MKRILVPMLTILLLGGTMCWQSSMPETVLCDPPDRHLGELPGFASERCEPGEAELETLPGDTAIEKRLYTGADGETFQVTLVTGGRSKNSIHRPELCLPSQGFLMTKPHTLTVGDVDWRVIVLDGGAGRPSSGLAYTFFNQDGFRTASHVQRIFRDVWDRSVYGRIDRWVLVTVFSTVADDAALGAFLPNLKGVVE